MPRYRHALIRLAVAGTATAAALVALPGTAGAASPKLVRTCNLLLDPVADTAPLDAPHLDILSGDIATGATSVAGVLRVRDLGTAATSALAGGRWDLSFGIDGARYTFGVRTDVFGAVQPSFTRDAGAGPRPAGPVTVSLNLVTDTITWTAPRSAVVELPAEPDGDTLAGLAARTYFGPADSTTDVATSTKTYTDGWPSCVTVA